MEIATTITYYICALLVMVLSIASVEFGHRIYILFMFIVLASVAVYLKSERFFYLCGFVWTGVGVATFITSQFTSEEEKDKKN